MPRKNHSASVPQSTGVGESVPHAAYATDPEAFELSNPLNDPRHPANCTLGGEPIPDHLWSKIMYGQTDQGMAEREEETRDLPKPTAGLEFIRDEVHQSIRRHGDDLDRGKNPPNASSVITSQMLEDFDADEAYDPRVQLVRRHVPVGMRAKFLAAHEVTGNSAVDGYQICMDDGQPVRHGSSTLAFIPENRAKARQAGFERKAREQQAEIHAVNTDLLQQEERLRGDFSSIASFERPAPSGADLGLQEESFGEDLT